MLSPTSVMEMVGAGEQSRVEEETRQGTATDVVVASVDGELIPFVGGRMDDWHSLTTGKMGTAHSSAPGEKQRVEGERSAPEMGTGRRDGREIARERNNEGEKQRVGGETSAPEMGTRRRDGREISRERNSESEERRWHRRWGLGGETGERSRGRETASRRRDVGTRDGDWEERRERSRGRETASRRRDVGTGDGEWEQRRGERSKA